MRKIQKFLSFLEFSLEYKMHKLVKNMTLEQLSDLCCSFLPSMDGCKSLADRGQAAMVVGVIEQELKKRYPNNILLQSTDFSKPKEVSKILEKLGGLNK